MIFPPIALKGGLSALKLISRLFVIEATMNYGATHPMIGTVLMLFLGLPSMTRSL